MGYRDTFFDENNSNYGWYTCARCGKKLRKGDSDIDHILPRNYGGWDSADNLQCLCKHCNRSKKDSMRDTVPDYVKNNARRVGNKVGSLFK